MSHWSSVENLTAYTDRFTGLLSVVPAARLRTFAYLLIALWFLIILSDLFWSLVPVPEVKGAKSATAIALNTGQKQSATPSDVNVEQMQSWHLFGQAQKQTEVKQVVQQSAQNVKEDVGETRLNLNLLGIIKAEDPDKGFAIIAYQSKSELYKVGEKIPGGRDVSLAKVLSDRVIIDNRGSYEALLLWDIKKQQSLAKRPVQQTAASAAKKRVVDQRSDSRISAMASDYKKKLLSNPMSLADVIKISVAKDGNGNIIGYRVRPGQHRKQFSDFGLKSGDIITAVNGTSLNDPAQAMQLYGQLKEATEASFDVKRGNEELTLIINLSEG